ncbi:anti-sigma(V) factor RsiV [Gottschalkia purinilytica]|uniref:Anti-sigma(V) factor RsiV n=1 Tax=Gottschalkia purinilytica TaxID=1503 RepID=A0A0L0W847_GOTPU|nr:DUF3298 and DUF4163 domain-containing protein [Gottschalkia purinilytica]KNF07617.1 anti-sigma(V) factor RsiV [Gottschalkia purinilytica]
MNNRKLDELKKEYMNTPIPDELDFIVRKSLKSGGKKNMKRNNKFKLIGAIAASAIIFTGAVNTSPPIANALSEIPVIKSLVKVVNFTEYNIKEDNFEANIKVPKISDLENKDLENSLNEKYIKENKKLYDDFITQMEKLKSKGKGNLGLDAGYEVKTDNERILSVGRYVTNTMASSSTEIKYDTIDKRNQILITLPSLFKNNSYVNVISENIKKQMKEQMKSDTGKVYFVDTGNKEDEPIDLFEKIAKDQNFYINKDGKLVISFNEYDVAPGYMGVVEFVIPTDVISNILVGNEYIK